MNTRSLTLLAALSLLTGAVAVPSAHAGVIDWSERGANIVSTSAADFDSDGFHQSLQNLRNTGANTVSLVLPLGQDSQTSSTVYGTAALPATTTLARAIDYAHSIGLAVVLKPHVDTPGVWRAYINPSNRSQWFASYQAQILPLARVGQAHHAEAFVVGTELITLASDDQYSDNTAHWRALISAIRSVYSGKLSYGANWGTGWADEKNRVAFWDALDYAGIEAYYPLGSDYYNNAVDSLKGYWAQWDASDISVFKARVGKPVIFTEVGYMSTNGAHTMPGDGGHIDGVNLTEQANDYTALFSYWGDSPEISGMQLWEWKSDPNGRGPNDWDYTPQLKPAQDVMSSFFTGGGPVTHSFTTSASTTGSSLGNPVAITASVTNTGSSASGLVIDIEVYNSSGQRVYQRFYENESIAANTTKQYAGSWAPPSTGTYTLKLGVFSSGWASNYAWNNNAATIAVVSGNTGGGASAFSISGGAPSSGSTGSSMTLSAHATDTGGAGSALIDIELYDSGGSRVLQQFFDNQSFLANQSRDYSASWTPTNAGTYTLKLGVFTPGWSSLYQWINQAATIAISSGSGGTGTTTTGTNTSSSQNAASVSPATEAVSPNASIDFSGRNFGHEEAVVITQNGLAVRQVHADGGGNFSTGSLSMPAATGTYTLLFTGQTSGLTATSTITVQ